MSLPPPPHEFELHRLQSQLNGWELHYFPELESTNDWALRSLRAHPPERPCLILAQRQTRGRGRGSHSWQAPAGNLTCSFAFQLAPIPDWPTSAPQPHQAAHLAIASSVAVWETIKARRPAASCVIKWPNDVLIGGRKVAGILIESPHTAVASHTNSRLVVIGVGLNANSTPSLASLDNEGKRAIQPTSLAAECQCSIDLTDLLIDLSSNLARHLGAIGLLTLPSAPATSIASSCLELRQLYEQALAWRGEWVVLQRGDEQLVGELLGVDEQGQLRIQPVGAAPVSVVSGELRLADSN